MPKRSRLKRPVWSTVARDNGMTPMAVYALFPSVQGSNTIDVSTMSMDALEVHFAGSGLGCKTLAEVCDEIGIDGAMAIVRLSQAGIDATPDSRLKALADMHE